MHRIVVACIDHLGAIARRRGRVDRVEAARTNLVLPKWQLAATRWVTNEPNPAKMAAQVVGGSRGMRRTKPRSRLPGARSARTKPSSRPSAAGSARTKPSSSVGAGSARTKPTGAFLSRDDPRRNGVRLGTTLASMHAIEGGTSLDEKTPGWTIVLRVERIHPAPLFQPLAALERLLERALNRDHPGG
jgi:hypothetical protein